MTKWVGKNHHCPTCRNAVSLSDILTVDLRVSEEKVAGVEGDEAMTEEKPSALVLKYGSKPTAVLKYCKEKLLPPGAAGAKMLLFSSHDESLKVMSKTLTDAGIGNVTCLRGDKDIAETIDKFKRVGSRKSILLLNSSDLAAGTNLQCASYVLFLEPAGSNTAAALSIETQAIGRCAIESPVHCVVCSAGRGAHTVIPGHVASGS